MMVCKLLTGHCYALCLLMLCAVSGYGQNSWTGKVSSDWGTPANWSNGMVPGSMDNIQIGITAFTNQPTVNNNQRVNNLTLGGPLPVILTVNAGDTLRVGTKLVQNHAADNSLPSSLITGGGAMLAGSIMVGDLITPKLVQSKTTVLSSNIAALNVSGSITLNSTTANLFTGGVANNNSQFSLQGGVLNLGLQIITTNQMPPSCNSFAGNYPNAKFSIDINSAQNATLVLADSNAVALANPLYATVDFYNPISGTGRSLVNYAGANQLVYTNTIPGIDMSPMTYEDLTISGTGIKTAGSKTTNHLGINGNLTVLSGILDLNAFSPQTLVNGNFYNTGTINLGTLTTTINGATFFNAGNFNVSTGIIQFSGAAQALTDSTMNGTNFRRVSFNNAGIKNIQAGKFSIVPNGKVRLSNNATLNVVTGATLQIRADSTGTAVIAALAAGCSVTGQVNVEHYIQGSVYLKNTSGRAYRMLTSPVNYTNTISGDRNFNINYLKGTTLYNGIITTGTNGGGFDLPGNPSLYLLREDVAVCNNSFTCGNQRGLVLINYPDPNLIGMQTRGNLNYTADTTVYLPVGTGMYTFYRGNKVLNNGTTSGTKTSQPYNYPENTVLQFTGFINQRDVQMKDWFRQDHILSYTNSPNVANSIPGQNDRGFSLLGNPYPATINFDHLSTTDSTSSIYAPNLIAAVYIYNQSNGQFNAYMSDSTHNMTQLYTGTGVATNLVASGVGFGAVVDPNSPNPYAASLTIREGAKFDTDAGSTPGTFNDSDNGQPQQLMAAQRSNLVRTNSLTALNSSFQRTPAPPVNSSKSKVAGSVIKNDIGNRKAIVDGPEQLIRFTLYQQNDKIHDDDILIKFKAGAVNSFNPKEDAMDMGGNEEAMVMLSSYSSNHLPLAINSWPALKKTERIGLFSDAKESGSFTLKATAIENIPLSYEVRLRDKLTGKTVNLRQVNHYVFSIDKNNPKTFGDRFELLMQKNN